MTCPFSACIFFLAQIVVCLLVIGRVCDTFIVSSHDRVFQRNCGDDVIKKYVSNKIRGELLFALESARTRLAIAMTAETKSTPVELWRYYLDMANRLCLLIKKLRAAGQDLDPVLNHWICALSALRQISIHDKARPLCRVLEDIVTELE
jgi:hypothetical protein